MYDTTINGLQPTINNMIDGLTIPEAPAELASMKETFRLVDSNVTDSGSLSIKGVVSRPALEAALSVFEKGIANNPKNASKHIKHIENIKHLLIGFDLQHKEDPRVVDSPDEYSINYLSEQEVENYVNNIANQ